MGPAGMKWRWYWGIWALMGLYMATWDLAMYPSAPALRILVLNLLQNGTWALLGLFLIWLADRHPIESFAWSQWRTWGLHLLASVLVAALGLFLAYLISLVVATGWEKPMDPSQIWMGLPRFYRAYFHMNLLFMWAVVAAFHGMRIYRKYKAREVETAQLEARFAEAQNLALRMQLQPHFLFNTLNSISALVHSNPDGADDMISRLGDFLRMTLEASPDQMVPLRKELAFIRAYLAIEQVRFQSRLRVELDVPAGLQDYLRVPSFILQPLVENALKHGLSDRTQGGTLRLRASRDSDHLTLEVQDDGEGYLPGPEGVGLGNVRARLGLIYKGNYQLDIMGILGRGTLVVLRLPLDDTGGEGP